jgi:flagellar protein FliJ
MVRSARLEPVRDVAVDAERRAAEAFAAAEARLRELEAKLAELGRYEQEYRELLRTRSEAGIDAMQLRSFHAFIARLGDAIGQQRTLVEGAGAERELARTRWLEATRRARAVGKVIEHASAAEQRVRDRHEQADLDERAQRASVAAAAVRRNERANDHNREDT